MIDAVVGDLGGGRRRTWVWRAGVDRSTCVPCGLLLTHPMRGGGECRTLVTWAGPDAVVGLESLVPLTLVGDFVCACSCVGSVTDGHWVPATQRQPGRQAGPSW